MPERPHPFPSRTRKLSSPGPMVLQGPLCGRVGRCRGIFQIGPVFTDRPFRFFGARSSRRRELASRMRFAIIEAPSVLGLTPGGVEDLPATLLGAGLAARLGARRVGAVKPPAYDERRDPVHGFLNAPGIARYASDLADVIGVVVEAGETPLVLGGDCSILLGSMLALRRRGRYGLLFLDGHTDFYQPAANVNGQVASS